ncbi:MAG: amidohydrolase [Actinomycetota bacterium]
MIVVHRARAVVTMAGCLHRRDLTAADVPLAEAVAVDGDRIVAVGSIDDVVAAIERDFPDSPHTIDDTFVDSVILPGLIDQHLHPILGASTLATEVIATEDWVLPDVTYPAAHTAEEYADRVTAAHDRMTAAGDLDGWLFTWGYHRLWHGTVDRAALDAISDTRPICVWQRSIHEFHLNTPALRALGLLDRDLDAEVAAGALDPGVAATARVDVGHFWERGNFALLFPLVSRHLFDPARLERGLRQMVAYLHQNGVTAFNEPGAILVPGAWEQYERILGHDDTPFASYFITDGRGPAEAGMSHADTLARARRQIESAPSGKLSFFDAQVKLFADGAILSQLMQMREPYVDEHGAPDPHHHGEWIMPPEMFAERAELYWEHGYQLHVHVNGDAGLDMVLDNVERLLQRTPREDHRTVIVHFANSTEEQVDRIERLGCIVSSNPYYPVGFADKYGEWGLGPERADSMTRHRSVLDRGVSLSFHSDLPIGRSDPIGMMACAVDRITPSGRVAGPEQRIGVAEALRAVTIGAAHSWRREHDLGSIEPGKLANFTVVDSNPLDVDPERSPGALDDVHVEGTVFEGRWFPVPAGRSRTSVSGARRGLRESLRVLAGAGGEPPGCVCTFAHELARALAA